MLNSGSPTFLLSIERPWFWTFHEENAWEIKHFMQIVKMYNWMSIGSTVNLASSCPWRGRRQIGGVWARPENKEVGRATVASLMKRLEEREKKKNWRKVVFSGHLSMPLGWGARTERKRPKDQQREETDGARSQKGRKTWIQELMFPKVLFID